MNESTSLINEIRQARDRMVDTVRNLTEPQAQFKPDEESWSVVEVLEHLVIAENGTLNKVWKAAEAHRRGESVWTGEPTNKGLSFDEIAARTWKPKEKAPSQGVIPRKGGPLAYWMSCMAANQAILEDLEKQLEGLALSEIICHPHSISGPLDARQRLQFIRFHIDWHLKQIKSLKGYKTFPKD